MAYLTYGLAAWGQAAKTHLQKILVLQKRVLRFIEAGVIDCSVSDHDIIFADLRLKASRPKVTYVKTRSFKNYNPDVFQYDMSFAPWSVLEIFDDVDDKSHAFDLLLNEILDHHAPIRSIKVRGKPNPCITEETRELMKSRNYWRKRARRTDNPADWSTYKNLKHQVRKLIRAAESEFVKDQIQNNPQIQIVFGRQFAFVSLKDLSPQKYLAKMTRPWRMILTTFLHQSENLQILKLNLWMKSTTSFFMKTLLLLNFFLLVSNLHLIMLIVNKSRMS